MSDEFISDRITFCTILDRKENFEILNYVFFIIGHVTTEDMEMSEIALRIEWKHFRIPAGPASGRNCPLNSRNLGFGHEGTFFQNFEKFEKWEVQKKMLPGESKLFLSLWNRSEVLRDPVGCASIHKGPLPSRTVRMLLIRSATYLIFDLAISGP